MTDNRWEKTCTMKENDKKGNDRAPDYRGSFTLDGKEYNFSLWPAKSGNGWSGKIEERQAQHNNQVTSGDDLDDNTAPF